MLPAGQRDRLAAERLVEVLRRGEVEVERSRAPFEADGRRYESGALVVRMQQPASGFAKTVLERQRYPDLRAGEDGQPRRPYDVTAHTLPLLLGVEVDTIAAPFAAQLEPLGAGAGLRRTAGGCRAAARVRPHERRARGQPRACSRTA